MRDSDHERPHDPPVRAGRRTTVGVAHVGEDLHDREALAPLRTVAPVESDETYLLSMYGDAS